MKTTILTPLALGAFSLTILTTAFAQSTWDGGGVGTNWSTVANWAGDTLPASGADVTFGTAFTSGTSITLGTNRIVGLLTFDSGANVIALGGSTLTVNTGIVRTATTTANSAINSALSLPGNITINNNSGGTVTLGAAITGVGNIALATTSGTAISLSLSGSNTGWSGGLTLTGSAAANSSVNVNAASALGTGDITWLAGTNGPNVTLNADTNYTLANNFIVNGERIINPYNVSGGLGKTIAFNGNITGSAGSTIRFIPRQTNITGAITELNGTNTNADSASRIVFYGSTNDTTQARGNTYVIGNAAALNWGRAILGQTATAQDEVAVLYKDGITISRLMELNETDAGAATMGVYGTNANATQSGGILLNNFGGAFSKAFRLSADSGSTFTVSGAMTTTNAADTLNVEKIGVGTVNLTSASGNSYTGTTTVTTGTLLISNTTGSGTGTGAVTVSSGAAIGGDGTIGGNLTLSNGAKFVFDLNDTPLNVSGTFALSNTFGVDDLVTSSLGAIDWSTVGDGTYTLLGTSFAFNAGNIENFGLANAFSSGGKQMYFANGSLDLVVVPEPSTAAMLTLSLLLTVAVIARRRRTND